jgi:chromosome segregation ATPase
MEENENDEIRDPKAVLEALERAKADAKKFREELEAVQAQMTELEKTRDALKETVKTYEEGGNEWKSRTKELMVKGQLGTNADRLMKFIDMESIDFAEDGNITGLDEAVSKVKADLPELFDPKRRVAGAADLFDKGEVAKKVTGTEAQVARIVNGR